MPTCNPQITLKGSKKNVFDEEKQVILGLN